MVVTQPQQSGPNSKTVPGFQREFAFGYTPGGFGRPGKLVVMGPEKALVRVSGVAGSGVDVSGVDQKTTTNHVMTFTGPAGKIARIRKELPEISAETIMG